MISNSRNKLHQTTYKDSFSALLYLNIREISHTYILPFTLSPIYMWTIVGGRTLNKSNRKFMPYLSAIFYWTPLYGLYVV